MSEPVYLDRNSYVAIARAAIGAETYDALPVWRQSDAAHEAQRAHLELHVGFIKDRDLNPRQLAFREAYRAFIAPPKPVVAEPAPPTRTNSEQAVVDYFEAELAHRKALDELIQNAPSDATIRLDPAAPPLRIAPEILPPSPPVSGKKKKS